MGSAYAYHPRRRAPANKLSAPTGAKFRFCAMRAKPARTVSPNANGLAALFSIDFSSLRLSISQARTGTVRFPQSLRRAGDVARPAAPHEQRIAQPVKIPHGFGGNILFTRQS